MIKWHYIYTLHYIDMAPRITIETIDKAQKLLNSGMTLKQTSVELGRSCSSLSIHLKSIGFDTKISTHKPAHNRIVTLDENKIIDEYLKGFSVLKLAKKNNVCRQVITRIIRSKEIPVRNISESSFVRMSNLTESERKDLTRNANKSFNEQKERIISQGKIAFAKNVQFGNNAISMGPGEIELAESFGNLAIPQFAIGPYNIDFMIDNIAIEVKTNGGSSKARGKERNKVKHLLSLGFKVCYVDLIGQMIIKESIPYILGYIEIIKKLPFCENKYWLVRCGYQQNPMGRQNGWIEKPPILPPEAVYSIRDRFI